MIDGELEFIPASVVLVLIRRPLGPEVTSCGWGTQWHRAHRHFQLQGQRPGVWTTLCHTRRDRCDGCGLRCVMLVGAGVTGVWTAL